MSKPTDPPSEMEATDPVDKFVSDVGNKVRIARGHRDITRRELSDLSGISERYLAQLESGSSNVSVALLYKIAAALQKTPDWFLGNEFVDDETFCLIQKYRAANPILKEQIQELLNADITNSEKAERICLIGLRGAGKSTLGRLLAAQLGFEFVELSRLIEEESGMPISEVIALYGQEGYHQRESQMIEELCNRKDQMVLAVGGGIVSEITTFRKILTKFHSVWLRASPQEHMQRVRDQGDYRPMAGNPNAMSDLKAILSSREEQYSKADITVDTSNQTLEESSNAVFEAIRTLVLQSYQETA